MIISYSSFEYISSDILSPACHPKLFTRERGAFRPRRLLTDDLRGGEFDYCITPGVTNYWGAMRYSRIASRIQSGRSCRNAVPLMNGVSRARGPSPSTSRAFASRRQDVLIKIRRDRAPGLSGVPGVDARCA